MQTPMFVFVGLKENKIEQDIIALSEKFQQIFEKRKLPIKFIKKDELLHARFDNVSFYVSIIRNKEELKDWTEITEDAELDGHQQPVDEVEFIECKNRKKIKNPTLYNEQHYSIAKTIFDSLNNFGQMEIYFYH
jgi:hypothetical protein